MSEYPLALGVLIVLMWLLTVGGLTVLLWRLSLFVNNNQ